MTVSDTSMEAYGQLRESPKLGELQLQVIRYIISSDVYVQRDVQ